jgi:hypothetical protein
MKLKVGYQVISPLLRHLRSNLLWWNQQLNKLENNSEEQYFTQNA